jgi:DNA-binding NtrC family response regulator
MRFFVLSVSADEGLSPIRNTVLAHAGYGVIPVASAAKAIEVLSSRHVSVLVIGHSISFAECNRLCSEAQKHNIPALILSAYEPHRTGSPFQAYINPLDGPEVLLEAVANLLKTVEELSAHGKSH